MREKSANSGRDENPGSPRSRHFAHFDAMRAIAVLGILIIHVGAVSGANMTAWYGVATSQGRLGVRIFFMISAFLLYRPYVVAHLQGERGPALGTYAKRRILRILPGYWVALTVLAIWPGLTGVLTKDWWIYYGVLQSFFPVCSQNRSAPKSLTPKPVVSGSESRSRSRQNPATTRGFFDQGPGISGKSLLAQTQWRRGRDSNPR
jgi:hypothetical protein